MEEYTYYSYFYCSIADTNTLFVYELEWLWIYVELFILQFIVSFVYRESVVLLFTPCMYIDVWYLNEDKRLFSLLH